MSADVVLSLLDSLISQVIHTRFPTLIYLPDRLAYVTLPDNTGVHVPVSMVGTSLPPNFRALLNAADGAETGCAKSIRFGVSAALPSAKNWLPSYS